MSKVNNLKYKKEYLFWKNFKGRKMKKWNTIYQRLKRGESIQEAIRPEIKTKRKITQIGQDCARCGLFKTNIFFSKSVHAKNGLMNKCKECMKEIKIEYRSKKENREQENKYKSDFRKTDKGKLRVKFDNLFYTNKGVIKNREITKGLKNTINKYEWLIYTKGIDVELVNFAYGINFRHTIESSNRL